MESIIYDRIKEKPITNEITNGHEPLTNDVFIQVVFYNDVYVVIGNNIHITIKM